MIDPSAALLDRLEAEERIRWTLAWLPQLFDAREELDTLLGAFTEDVEMTWDHPAVRIRGRSAVAEAIAERWRRWEASAGYLTNLRIDWVDEVARVTSYHQYWIWHAGQSGERTRPADRVRAWTVQDLMCRSATGWAIKRRRFQVLGPGGVAL